MDPNRPARTLPRSGLLAVAAGLLATTVVTVSARSSCTARFEAPVAGPALEQTAVLLLDLFPGDGEAVLEVRERWPASVELLEVTSSLGQARLTAAGLRVDYRAAPVARAARDTLRVRLHAPAEAVPVSFSLVSSVDSGSGPAYGAEAVLAVVPPLDLEAVLTPALVYPGETVEVVLTIDSVDPRVDTLDAATVRWPEAVVALGPAARVASGHALERRQALRVRPHARGEWPVVVTVAGAGVPASPVALKPLRIGTVPGYAVSVAADPTRGQRVRLTLSWTNPGDRALPYAALEAEAAYGLYAARLPAGPAGVRLEADEEKGSVHVRVDGPGHLAPGATLAVALEAVPRVTGPLRVAGFFLPPDRDRRVGLTAPDVLRIAAPRGPGVAAVDLPRTDLELAVAALEPRLREALAELPLGRGAGVALHAERADEGNWVVEILLTDLLRARGVRVLVDSAASAQLRYRLADARVVYHPAGSAWNLFSQAQAREARAEVFLQLVEGRRLRWARQVTARGEEARAPGSTEWLGGARGIDQAEVAADHRALEMGLSGLIAGGLFFVFFAP